MSIKTSGAVTTILAIVNSHVVKRGLVESSSCILIGTRISTGVLFQRAFPSITALNQWLISGDGSDIDVTRVEPLVMFTS